jgi:hypothetical protein
MGPLTVIIVVTANTVLKLVLMVQSTVLLLVNFSVRVPALEQESVSG